MVQNMKYVEWNVDNFCILMSKISLDLNIFIVCLYFTIYMAWFIQVCWALRWKKVFRITCFILFSVSLVKCSIYFLSCSICLCLLYYILTWLNYELLYCLEINYNWNYLINIIIEIYKNSKGQPNDGCACYQNRNFVCCSYFMSLT